ncbi:MAG TPA: DUF692 family protein [Polyangiaceae bacterium]
MAAHLPRRPEVLGLGVGLDLRWGRDPGMLYDETHGDVVSHSVVRFLERHVGEFGHLFVSWQPKDGGKLDARQYFPAYDDLFARVGHLYTIRALHQTALNLGALERYDRREILQLTNALIRRYDLGWVNEDLGLWSIHGKPLPYPLAPYLTDDGLDAAIRNVREVRLALDAPLLVEFPGFSDGVAFFIGKLHAYDFFRVVAEESEVGVTLDTGHLLSYQWLVGKRGADLWGELERLPLDRCFEIHLSGCEIRNDRFFDLHHGVLLDAQLELLDRLVGSCPNVRAITYEDPVFDGEGQLTDAAAASFAALRLKMAGVMSR